MALLLHHHCLKIPNCHALTLIALEIINVLKQNAVPNTVGAGIVFGLGWGLLAVSRFHHRSGTRVSH